MSTPYATGCSQICNDGRDCTCAAQPCQSAAHEGGNVWFAEPEPPEPMTCADMLALSLLIAFSFLGVGTAIYTGWKLIFN